MKSLQIQNIDLKSLKYKQYKQCKSVVLHKWVICDILFPTVHFCIPSACKGEGKYTAAESIRPRHTTAWNTPTGILSDVGGKQRFSEMLRVAPKITPVFAFRI